MTSSLVAVIAVVAGIVWLAFMFVSAVRNRGSEEVAPNLQPPINDQVMETTRLENYQKAAILFAGFLAVALPMYFLSETSRQDGFVEEFAHESEARGAHIVAEFACFSCHGPDGVGGAASYVEKRSGVSVQWEAPSLNDVLYRYDEDELNFWITYGRGNTPMPAWGLAGGGPLNELQVIDVVNYLKSIQVSQAEALNKVAPAIDVQLDRIEGGNAAIEAAILNQRQVIEEINQAAADASAVQELATRAREIFDVASDGIDTDDDGLSDAAEAALTDLSNEALAYYGTYSPIVLDPAVNDAGSVSQAIEDLTLAAETDPILETNLAAIEAAAAGGRVGNGGLGEAALADLSEIGDQARELGIEVPDSIATLADGEALIAALDAAATDGVEGASDLLGPAQTALEDGGDPDGDGLSTAAEKAISTQSADAAQKLVPDSLGSVDLDPADAESSGRDDLAAARAFVGSLESLATTTAVTRENQEKLLTSQNAGLVFLQNAAEARAWDVDYAGVASAMDGTEEEARHAVGLFNSNCARCHTAGFAAGVPFTQEIGSGGFGPALWDGRPVVQFGPVPTPPEEDLLVKFLTRGSEAETPYGLNGFGSGRMPAFGNILSAEDLDLLARYLRSGNLSGKG